MNYRMLYYLLGVILLIEAVLLLLPLAVALLYGESFMPFLLTVALILLVSVPAVLFRPRNTRIYAKEGFVCVAAGWILMSAFGALPFVLSGAIPNYIDALFETVSGFTTTGASILTEIEVLPRGILFWRSFTHWIGGMGVLVFMLAILPTTGGQAIHLLRAEVPGPTKGKLVPRIRQTAIILYGIYLFLTVVQILALKIAGLDFYDAVVSTFATAGTGGFSVKNASIAGYGNAAVEWIIAVFMILFGINFNIYFYILVRRFREVTGNEELKAYLLIVLASVTAIAINTRHLFRGVGDCIRAALFQVATIVSTTGFATVDYNLWPEFSKTILVMLMIVGACAGSTAGGLKVSRILILAKGMLKEIKHILRPHSVNVVRLDGEPLPDSTVRATSNYLSIYMAIIMITTLLLSIDGFSLTTNLTATLACINNIGPGLDMVGPTGNFSAFSYFSKIILTFNMLFGRLEIMPMLILFYPNTWRRYKIRWGGEKRAHTI